MHWTKDEIIKAIKKAFTQGRDLSYNAMAGKQQPLVSASAYHFGSYRKAVERAGVDYAEGVSPITNELQGVARIGNQVIFDDVLPKLRAIWRGPVLRGADARRSDELVLAEEQSMIQHLYDSTDADTRQRFATIADMGYTRAWVGSTVLRQGGHISAGAYNRAITTPTFHSLVPGGDINTPQDRWRYGMALGGAASTLPSYGAPSAAMPAVGAEYASSAQFDRLNVRPHLHRLDAMLNDTDMEETEIVVQLRALSPLEQRELAASPYRLHRLAIGLSFAELKLGIGSLADMPLDAKLRCLGRSLLDESWATTSYVEIQDMIKLARDANAAFLTALHTDAWRSVFLAICDDKTIHTAVADLRLPPAMATDWIYRETHWW